MITEIPQILMNDEFYFSALILLEYLQTNTKLKLKCLYHLDYKKKLLNIIESNTELLEDFEIKKIYLRICKPSELINIESKRIDKQSNLHLNQKSVELYLIGKLFKGKHRAEKFVEAFKLDERNFEALVSLYREYLVSEYIIYNLIDEMDSSELKNLYKDIIISQSIKFGSKDGDSERCLRDIQIQNNDFYTSIYKSTHEMSLMRNINFFSPFFGEVLGRKLLLESKNDDLFRLGVYMVENFDSEISYLVLGCFYIGSKNYKESKKCFYKALKINDEYGTAWFFLGISYSNLKECENAISSFKKAEKFLIADYKPSLYLAFEYHRMNNYDKAYIYYKQAFDIEKNPEITYRYAAFLIYYQNYDRANELLDLIPQKLIKSILCAFILYYKKQFSDAYDQLYEKDWRSFALKGFLLHIMMDQSKASDYYSEALIIHDCTVIRDLLSICNSKYKSSPAEYACDLFEAMDIKNMTEMPL